MDDNYDISRVYNLQDDLLTLKDNLEICAKIVEGISEKQSINKKLFNVLNYRLDKIEYIHANVISWFETFTKDKKENGTKEEKDETGKAE